MIGFIRKFGYPGYQIKYVKDVGKKNILMPSYHILCFLGLHKWDTWSKYLPSIHSIIVTDFISHTECIHCHKVKRHLHWTWNGEKMINYS